MAPGVAPADTLHFSAARAHPRALLLPSHGNRTRTLAAMHGNRTRSLHGNRLNHTRPQLLHGNKTRLFLHGNRSRLGAKAQSQPCVLATVSYGGHFRVLTQFFLSYAANVLDPRACGLMVLVSTEAEVTALTKLLHDEAPRLGEAVLPQMTIVALPTVLTLLSPGTATALPSTKNKGQWGRLYVCAKKAYAARYAHEVLGAEHAIVTDSEAYIWKPMSIAQLFHAARTAPTVWYADAPILHKPERGVGAAASAASTKASGSGGAGGAGGAGGGASSSATGAASAYGNLRAKVDTNWCSLHVFRDSRGLTRQQLQQRVPSSTATLFEYMLFSYPRGAFRQYWHAVETTWQRPWFDALVRAHEVEPRCVGVGFWLEVSWHLFLYEARRPQVAFANATARIERALGSRFVRQGLYVNARLELLWRALSNHTYEGFRRFYAEAPALPLFRFEFRQRGNCLPLRLVAELPPPAASFQANSAVPNWVFGHCAAELALLQRWRHAAHMANADAPLPWVRHTTSTR